MFVNGAIVGSRFRVLRNLGPAAGSIALADEPGRSERVWLIRIEASVTDQQLSLMLQQQGRFALGVPGLARPLVSGVDSGAAFLAFVAPAGGSVAEAHREAWAPARIAALATRVAAALGPLHDQGIAHGCLRAELVAEGDVRAHAPADVLFGFGVAAVATAFGAAGEASQLLPPQYRAPELRARLLPPTPSSDVFALGVLLRELLSGPDLVPNPALTGELEACLASATASDARERPRDVRAFARELTRLAASEPLPRALSSDARGVETGSDVAVGDVAVGDVAVGDVAVGDVAVGDVAVDADVAVGDAAVTDVANAAAAPTDVAVAHAALPGMPRQDAPPAPSAPPPSAYPLLAVAPDAFPAPVTAWKPAPGRAALVWLAVGLGALLMGVGVPTATFFATRHAATLAPHVPAASAPKLRLPRPTAPVPAAPPAEPSVAPESEPLASRKTTSNHPPMVAPGRGSMSFPEDAHAPLPVLGTEPIWGTRRAPLTWVLFGDLDCPHTRRAWRALTAVKASFGDDLRIVFRHRPLREHPNAFDAARVLAGLSIRRGSLAFFDVLDRISRDDASLTEQHLQALLTLAGYGGESLAELGREGEPVVLRDVQLAGQFAVDSTPFSFLNGQPIEGERTPAELERLLDDEHRSTTWSLASGVTANTLYSVRASSNLIGVGEATAARVCAPLTTSPVRGASDALVTLVEFSDFECPFCARVEPTLRALLERYPKTLRLVWKNYPLPQHKNARLLASFAADAKARGSSAAFWAVHDALFEHQGGLDDSTLGELAGKAGLDGALLLVSARSGLHDAEIQSDIAVGQKLGVNGTPVFFVNGRRVQGALGLEQFDALIREELKSAERIVARGVPKKDVYGLLCE